MNSDSFKKTYSLNKPTERAQQMAFIEWFRIKYPKLTIYHIPNGELRNKIVGSNLKKMGVLAGVFDLHLMDYHLFIEFKRNSKEKLSYKQKEFEEKAVNSGYNTMVVHGIDDAIEKIELFIKDRGDP